MVRCSNRCVVGSDSNKVGKGGVREREMREKTPVYDPKTQRTGN